MSIHDTSHMYCEQQNRENEIFTMKHRSETLNCKIEKEIKLYTQIWKIPSVHELESLISKWLYYLKIFKDSAQSL